MGQPVSITTASVPDAFCAGSLSTTWPFLVSLLSAELTGSASTFSFGSSTPAPEDQDKPWFRTNTDGSPDRWYVFANGAWLSRHPMEPGSVIMYQGTEASIETFDGGEAGVVTATSGPMWAKVADFNGRFPIGPGTLPSGLLIAIGDTGGLEEVTLGIPELPSHTHDVKQFRAPVQQGSGSSPLFHTNLGAGSLESITVSEATGDSEAHNNIPPFKSIWFIVKTARLNYRA